MLCLKAKVANVCPSCWRQQDGHTFLIFAFDIHLQHVPWRGVVRALAKRMDVPSCWCGGSLCPRQGGGHTFVTFALGQPKANVTHVCPICLRAHAKGMDIHLRLWPWGNPRQKSPMYVQPVCVGTRVWLVGAASQLY